MSAMIPGPPVAASAPPNIHHGHGDPAPPPPHEPAAVIRLSDSSEQVMRWFQTVTVPHECNLEELDGISGKDLVTLVESGDLLETLVEDVGLKKAKAKSILRTLEKMFPGGRKSSMHHMGSPQSMFMEKSRAPKFTKEQKQLIVEHFQEQVRLNMKNPKNITVRWVREKFGRAKFARQTLSGMLRKATGSPNSNAQLNNPTQSKQMYQSGVHPNCKTFRPFTEALTFIRSLKLTGTVQWFAWCKSGQRPADIPANPQITYKEHGWQGMRHWLGTESSVGPYRKRFRLFKDAVEFARSLKLKSDAEWRQWCTSGSRPPDIPSKPDMVYKDVGWGGMGHWLGSVQSQQKDFRPFEEAVAFARSLKLRGMEDWKNFSKSGKRPQDIPSCPNKTYKETGWKGFGDWLGTGAISSRHKKFLPFDEAVKYAQSLNLKTPSEWQAWCKSGNRPSNIPAAPAVFYKSTGWQGMENWLGNNYNKNRVYKKRASYGTERAAKRAADILEAPLAKKPTQPPPPEEHCFI